MEIIFTDANFEAEVIKSPVPVVVDFWAEWCGPCRAMGPLIEELANEFAAAKIKIGKLNVDQNQATAGQYNIMSVPTILVFKNGMVVDQMVGGMTKAALKEKFSKYVI